MWSPTVPSDAIYHSAIAHSARGTHWRKSNHKYIRKEGNRYIYNVHHHGGSSGKVGEGQNKALKTAKTIGSVLFPSMYSSLNSSAESIKYLKRDYDAKHPVRQYEEKQNGMSK